VSYQDYEWYLGYELCKKYEILDKYLPLRSDEILQVGCGSSSLSNGLFDDGYINLINIDISPTVIDHMAYKFADRETVKWETVDARKMLYNTESFSCVIEKGTLDALACSQDCFKDMFLMNKEICRVLKIGGYFISISFCTPDIRLKHLNRAVFPWTINVRTIELESHEKTANVEKPIYCIYVMKKTAIFNFDIDSVSNEWYDRFDEPNDVVPTSV